MKNSLFDSRKLFELTDKDFDFSDGDFIIEFNYKFLPKQPPCPLRTAINQVLKNKGLIK